jgi:hypothetical protein
MGVCNANGGLQAHASRCICFYLPLSNYCTELYFRLIPAYESLGYARIPHEMKAMRLVFDNLSSSHFQVTLTSLQFRWYATVTVHKKNYSLFSMCLKTEDNPSSPVVIPVMGFLPPSTPRIRGFRIDRCINEDPISRVHETSTFNPQYHNPAIKLENTVNSLPRLEGRCGYRNLSIGRLTYPRVFDSKDIAAAGPKIGVEAMNAICDLQTDN